MKSFALSVLRRSLGKTSPLYALSDPVRASVWLSTLGAGLWTIAIITGVVPGNPLTAVGLFFWISLTLILTAISEAISETFTHRQTSSLQSARGVLLANQLASADPSSPVTSVLSNTLKSGDYVLVSTGETIPTDGEVVGGIATVDESALTGESAPVIREPSADRSTVTAGTRVISDWIIVQVRSTAGANYIDRMIAMMESHKRSRTPTEASIEIILAVSTLVCAILTLTVVSLGWAWAHALSKETPFGVLESLALFLCLSPTTVGALMPIVGVSGMLRLLRANVVAKNAQAVESAGNVDVMLIDKTGTITLGDRQAREFYPHEGIDQETFARNAQLASLADKTPEGRSIVVLAKQLLDIRQPYVPPAQLHFIPFSAQTRMSGVDLPHRQLRKGSLAAIEAWLRNQRIHSSAFPESVRAQTARISKEGGTPLVLADNQKGVLGVIALRDVIKGGLRERFAQLRILGIKTVMITGDNPLTAAAVAAEAGVDQFIAEATPEKKLELIRQLQSEGHLVSMTGDGTNDAPALAQADVALVMSSGTQPAKEAGNLIDLDNNPTKIIEVVRIGKQNLITTGSIMVFSNANDIAKYFALLPAMIGVLFPSLKVFDLIGFHSASQALMISLVFNAIIIPTLLPLAIMGTPFRPQASESLLRRNLVFYGLAGAATPFVVMKALTFIL